MLIPGKSFWWITTSLTIGNDTISSERIDLGRALLHSKHHAPNILSQASTFASFRIRRPTPWYHTELVHEYGDILTGEYTQLDHGVRHFRRKSKSFLISTQFQLASASFNLLHFPGTNESCHLRWVLVTPPQVTSEPVLHSHISHDSPLFHGSK